MLIISMIIDKFPNLIFNMPEHLMQSQFGFLFFQK